MEKYIEREINSQQELRRLICCAILPDTRADDDVVPHQNDGRVRDHHEQQQDQRQSRYFSLSHPRTSLMHSENPSKHLRLRYPLTVFGPA